MSTLESGRYENGNYKRDTPTPEADRDCCSRGSGNPYGEYVEKAQKDTRLREAQSKAWEQGRHSAFTDMNSWMNPSVEPETTLNPYEIELAQMRQEQAEDRILEARKGEH